MKKVAISILLTAALLTACGKSGSMDHSMHGGTSGSTGTPTPSESAGMNHSGMAQEAGSTQAGNVQAQFKLSGDKTMPNQDTTISIKIQDKDGKPIDKFDTVHEKQMHFIIVSKDLSFFNHIHPDYKGNGEFTVTTQFPTAGEFKVIADITPTGMGAMSKSQWITVQGVTPAQKSIEPDSSLTKVVDGKEVTLSFDHLMAGMELNLNFNIKDAASKQPVTDLQPYLGAVGHVVILTQDAENYLHVHPTDEKASGPDAKFMATFPHSGVYKIWGQFQQNGKVFTVPFVVKVP
jgi:major membrane immunogen (membrane-anchored lipoprotein)